MKKMNAFIAAVALIVVISCGGGGGSGSSGTTMEGQMTTMTNWEVHQTADQ